MTVVGVMNGPAINVVPGDDTLDALNTCDLFDIGNSVKF